MGRWAVNAIVIIQLLTNLGRVSTLYDDVNDPMQCVCDGQCHTSFKVDNTSPCPKCKKCPSCDPATKRSAMSKIYCNSTKYEYVEMAANYTYKCLYVSHAPATRAYINGSHCPGNGQLVVIDNPLNVEAVHAWAWHAIGSYFVEFWTSGQGDGAAAYSWTPDTENIETANYEWIDGPPTSYDDCLTVSTVKGKLNHRDCTNRAFNYICEEMH